MGRTESQAISKLASFLYDFLPGTPYPRADQQISFPGVAAAHGLSGFWQGGSKLPAINCLLSETLERQRSRFCGLLVDVVRRSIVYRQNKGEPITREDVVRLNDLVAEVGFKIPELHDLGFLDTLPRTSRSDSRIQSVVSTKQLHAVQARLVSLTGLPADERGRKFEDFLNELFEAFGLSARGSFRLTGEQIDGSFHLDGETYLLEAKWQNHRIGASELYELCGKVSGKATWSRGLLMSVSGFTQEGLEAFSRGKATNIICMDGLDLFHVLQGELDLRGVLRRKVRRAAETNQAFVPVRELFGNVI